MLGHLLHDADWSKRSSARIQVAAVTFSILAIELALIRWASGQMRILAYLNNLLMLSCFLGMGLGVVVGRRWPGLLHVALPVLALVMLPLAFSEQLTLVQLPFPDPTIHLWGAEEEGTILSFLGTSILVLALMVGTSAAFVCAGAALGHLLDQQPNLGTYSADLVGSLLGIAAIAATTALQATPPVWFVLGVLPLAWLSRRALAGFGLVACGALAQFSVGNALYSPYNRIELSQEGPRGVLSVNRDFHQYIYDLSDGAVNHAAPGLRDAILKNRKLYDIPWLLSDQRSRGVVIGAGTGNDVQAALRNGFKEVHSVDIDPRILELGRELHPEKPYSDPRAIPVNEDGRAFFEQYQGPPFDVVCFGFVDSHAMFSTMSTLRLDNFLYTEEGLRAAWQHVAKGGHLTLALSFLGGQWLQERLYWTLARATGQKPLLVAHDMHQGGTFVVTRNPEMLHLERVMPWPVVTLTAESESVLTTSDDWPYLYLRPGKVPWAYAFILVLLLGLAVTGTRYAYRLTHTAFAFHPALFCMGAAFMLLETRAITALSLLAGSTWVVNAAVFAGVLLMALAANLLVEKRGAMPVGIIFGALVGTLLFLFVFDASLLNRLPIGARTVVGGLMHGVPVGLAGLLVSTLLLRADQMPGALASNLLGSVLGGALEYLSMYVGLRSLLLLAMVLYLAAYLLLRRSAKGLVQQRQAA